MPVVRKLCLYRGGSWAIVVLLAAGPLSGLPAQAADPVVTALHPYGLQRGTEATVRIGGARLGDAEALLLYQPGIHAAAVTPVDDAQVDVRLSVAAECELGLHALRVRTASGISNLMLLSVGALPEVPEQEPNSDWSTPQAVPLGCTVSGVVQNEDVDYFTVEARRGDRIAVELEGLRLGAAPGDGTFFDPCIAILNAQRFELARCDDAALLQQDCLCVAIAPEDGAYVIEVRETAYGGSDLCRYRLHIGSFPRPTAVFPAGGRPGETLHAQWLGDPLGVWESHIALPAEAGPSSVFCAHAQDDRGIAPSPIRVRVNDLPNVCESEPNDAPDQATLGAVPAAFNGIVQPPGDVDHYQFPARAGETYDVRVYARQPHRSPLDSVLSVMRPDGTAIAGNDDDSGRPDSYVRFTAPDEGPYVVVIQDQLRSGASNYVYRLEVTAVKPSLVLSLPERVQYVPVTVSVPRGNRMAVLMSAARADFGGDVIVTPAGLPPGVTASEMHVPAHLTTIPVVFSAAADAPLGGALVDLMGRASDPAVAVTGQLAQRTMLVRGQNNVDVWGHDAGRLAVAVTDEAPFAVEIVQPQVPIVRDGSMQLQVVARRKDGFQGPIAVSLLYNPPGIGSAGAVSIAPDQSAALIPLTANSSPGVGQWPLVVLGRADAGGGTIDVASQPALLEIAEPFFTLAFEKSAAEIGQQADVIVRIEKQRDFAGTASAELLGLPAQTSTDPQPLAFTQDTQHLTFRVDVASDARPGKHQTLVCRAVVTLNGEPIVHTFGGGELRIDEPLPPAAEAASAAPQPAPAPAPTAAPARPLTRLEQLRLQKQQAGGGAPPAE